VNSSCSVRDTASVPVYYREKYYLNRRPFWKKRLTNVAISDKTRNIFVQNNKNCLNTAYKVFFFILKKFVLSAFQGERTVNN
jgi:hypothetical protein